MKETSATLPYGIAPTDHRLPAAIRLGRVRLQVQDLDRSLAFYEQVLGLRLQSREGAQAVLTAHDDDAPLVELHADPSVQPVRGRGRLGLFHFAILLPDRAALGRFVAHLAVNGLRAGASDHLVSEALYLSDPDGLGIEVYADRPREQWAHRDRQLAMATEPLDLDDVMSAAGGAPWTGMPRGTVMGHLHLHVGDIAEAAAFYHEALGLDKMVWEYPGALFLAAGGYHHHLGVNTWAAGAPSAGVRDARLLDWEMVLPSAAALEATLKSLAAVDAQVERLDAEGNEAVVRDPWGTALRLRS